MPAHAINAVEKPATRKFWRSLINKLKPTKKRDCTCAVCLYRDAVNMGVPKMTTMSPAEQYYYAEQGLQVRKAMLEARTYPELRYLQALDGYIQAMFAVHEQRAEANYLARDVVMVRAMYAPIMGMRR